jgi:TolB-like protein/Flp pilus assembly protein TadD
LGESPEDNQYIETIPRRGYRFVAIVTELNNSELLSADSNAQIGVEREETNGQGMVQIVREMVVQPDAAVLRVLRPNDVVSRNNNYKRTVMLLLPLIGIGLAGVFYYSNLIKRREPIDSIAVMPFVNVTGDPNIEYLSDGISDSIINRLSQIPNLKVTSFNSALRYKGSSTDPQEIGQALRVRAVVMGRLIKRGDDLSINIELIEVRDNRHLWGEEYKHKLTDITSVPIEISKEISERLRLELASEQRQQLSKRYTDNSEAYEAYLHGIFFSQNGTEAGQKKAIEYFEQAIKKDPNYAPAYVGLGEVYWESANYSYLSPKEAREKQVAVLHKALEIDASLAEAEAMLATVSQAEGDWTAAEKGFARAIALNSRAQNVHTKYARYLVAVGRNDEAITEAKRALELDPLSPSAVGGVAWVALNARQYDLAIEYFRKAIEMSPTDPRFHNNLARVLVQKGIYEEAVVEFQKGIALDRSAPGRPAHLAYTLAVMGKTAEARKLLDELGRRAKQSNVNPLNFAIIYAGLEKDKAFEWLEKCWPDRSGPPFIQIDPVFDRLRSDLRFVDLARRKGLAP